MAPASLVFGVDPGFASFGYALVALLPEGEEVLALGVVRTSKAAAKGHVLATSDNLRRTRELAAKLRPLVSAPGVRAIAAESMSFPRSSSVAGKMCLSWGIVATLAEELALPIVQASPQAVKAAVCGRKDASKADVQEALENRLGDLSGHLRGIPKGQWEHPFDALASVIAALDSDVVRMCRQLAKGAA